MSIEKSQSPLPMIDQLTAQELLTRYKVRLPQIWNNPNPYYDNKLYEISEVNGLIKKLEKITNGTYSKRM